MGEHKDCSEWDKLALRADDEATRYMPSAAGWDTICAAQERARLQLSGEDVGGHRIPFRERMWQFDSVVLPQQAIQNECIGRQDGFDIARQPLSATANWQLFCASFIFGYGTSAVGPVRFTRIINRTPQPALCQVIAEARKRLTTCGSLSAYDFLRGSDARRTVPYWGPAFFTKLLYFTDTSRKALILDNQVAWIVQQLSGMGHLVNRYGRSERWTVKRYAIYLAWMRRVAGVLHAEPDFLEYTLFREAARRRKRGRSVSEWQDELCVRSGASTAADERSAYASCCVKPVPRRAAMEQSGGVR